jgi:hypothetical protein
MLHIKNEWEFMGELYAVKCYYNFIFSMYIDC